MIISITLTSIDNPAARQYRTLRCSEHLSPVNIQMIKNWITECNTTHSACHQKEAAILPTRVIDVKTTEKSPHPRLVQTYKGQIGAYAALSHCWGVDVASQYRTTLATLDDRLVGMPLMDMPRNFQDAIEVARILGLQYLWIDSICIIQDSPEDKLLEIGKMLSVYEEAYVTICATASKSSQDGFLSRDALLQQPVVVMPFYPANNSGRGEYNMYPDSGHIVQGTWSTDVGNSVWSQRGWTFQERVLSRRTIHFTKNKIYFECRMSDGSEENDAPRQPIRNSLIYRFEQNRALGFFQSFDAANITLADIRIMYTAYFIFANQYSSRQLTFETDKPAAFSALVTKMAPYVRSQNVFGLWLDDILESLLWTNERTAAPASTSPLWPSWSWYNGKAVTWYNRNYISESPGPYQGRLFLKATFSPGASETNSGKLSFSAIVKEAMMFPMEDASRSLDIYISGQRVAYSRLDSADGNATLEPEVWLLSFADREVEVGILRTQIAGLILLPTAQPNEFRRIGTYSLYQCDIKMHPLAREKQVCITLV
jgi:hypothetical protein